MKMETKDGNGKIKKVQYMQNKNKDKKEVIKQILKWQENNVESQ